MPVSKKRKKKKPTRNNRPARGNNFKLKAEERLENKLRNSGHLKNYEVGKFKDRVSSLILDFAKDRMEMCTSEEMYLKVIPFVILCWNIGNAEEEHLREAGIQQMVKEIGPFVEEECRMLVNRKFTLYNEYKYLIVDYDITFPEDNLYLSVVSSKID